jgi:hypothetical protein
MAVLEGQANTPAASLDFALAKQPNWILDMFGMDVHGQPIARKILLRQNPERKRPGPVSISVRLRALPPEKVRVFLEDKEVVDKETLRSLATEVEAYYYADRYNGSRCSGKAKRPSLASTLVVGWQSGESRSKKIEPSEGRVSSLISGLALDSRQEEYIKRFFVEQSQSIRMPRPFDRCHFLERLRSGFRKEILAQLQRIDIFNKMVFKRHLQALADNSSVRKIAGRRLSFVSELDRELNSSERLGIFHDEDVLRDLLRQAGPLNAAIPANVVGTVALFRYLKFIKGYQIDINYRFAHTPEVAQGMADDDFAEKFPLTALSISAAASYLQGPKKKSYRPLMMMPKSSFRIVAPRSCGSDCSSLNTGVYLFQDDPGFSTAMSFCEMESRGMLRRKSVLVNSVDEHERTSILAEGDPLTRAILYFPYDFFNVEYNDCCSFDEPHNLLLPLGGMNFGEIVLFAHERLWQNVGFVRAVDIALRDAWLHLRNGGAYFDLIVDIMLGDRNYLKVLSRSGGLFNLKGVDDLAQADVPQAAPFELSPPKFDGLSSSAA